MSRPPGPGGKGIGGKGIGKAPPPPKAKAKPPGPPPAAERPGGSVNAAEAGPKLRPLFWQAVREVPEKSVWSSLVPPVAFNQTVLQKRFALAETRTLTRKGTGTSSTGSLNGDEPRKRLRVLDDKTSQMLAIAFNKLPAPEQLARVVDELDDFPNGLPAEAVIALNAAANEQKEAVDQLRQLKVSEAELLQLDLPERYLWVLGTKPLCAAKLACGALIVGDARELNELREDCERVSKCCQALRSSTLVLKSISTCLAVGNLMNRGTSRQDARAVVLPEALLKLEELRGVCDEAISAADNQRGISLLEFVAEALVTEEVAKSGDRCAQGRLKQEAEDLRQSIRAAQPVDLKEAEANCRRICSAAEKARNGIAGHLVMPSVASLASQVQQITQEATSAAQILEAAKSELAYSQEWLSAKPNSKAAEWLSGWTHFLEQLQGAMSRVQLPATLPAPVKVSAEQDRVLKDLTNPRGADMQLVSAVTTAPSVPAKPDVVMEPVTHQAQRQFEKPKKAMKLDDDERVEDLLARMASQGAAGSLFGGSPQAAERTPATRQEPPKPRTRVPLIYDSKENARFA
eukprot:CAMPEP_0197655920 /NCGR_PEP_ID=MMETSP1338-20131121/39749_1 /TAXON_ID=43686 ORGANISM="Pelagodinium beii, Strain RCC1491" /NCGR_SAMPLE_ID=MMETSP1338 /ASSEMBLY_ACC=CAM_ASM_000754 /LENGTH=573 /DNA_ID=CAMNT_0043231667 /DNA_START=24 /DNA_END=1745 /DNA_ORIENTATION=+